MIDKKGITDEKFNAEKENIQNVCVCAMCVRVCDITQYGVMSFIYTMYKQKLFLNIAIFAIKYSSCLIFLKRLAFPVGFHYWFLPASPSLSRLLSLSLLPLTLSLLKIEIKTFITNFSTEKDHF